MRLRYKKDKETGEEFDACYFNMHAMCEVLTGDDSAPCSELDAFVNSRWTDFLSAFRNKLIIPDNYNQFFGEPKTPEDKERGYFL